MFGTLIKDALSEVFAPLNNPSGFNRNELMQAASFNSWQTYQRVRNDLNTPRLVDLSAAFQAHAQNLIPDSIFKASFPGFMSKNFENVDVYHVDDNCREMANNAFSADTSAFHMTYKVMMFKDLPLQLLTCQACAFESIPGTVSAISEDLLIYDELFETVTGFEKDIFNFNANLFEIMNKFRDSLPDLSRRGRFSHFDYLSREKNGQKIVPFVTAICKEMFEPLKTKTKNRTDSLYNGWLNGTSSDVFKKFVTNDKSMFQNFDDTLYLTSITFTSFLKPSIKLISKSSRTSHNLSKPEIFLEAAEEVVSSEILNAFSHTLPSKFKYNINTIISCIVNAYKVKEYTSSSHYILLIPKSMLDYLIRHEALLSYAPHAEFKNVCATPLGVVTPDVIENFVSIWDKNPATFDSMWEVAKTV